MEITWYGHACFRLREKQVTIMTDPYDKSIGYTLPRVRADIVTVSHDMPGHNFVQGVKGEPRVLNGPGEYEIAGVFVTGISTLHHRPKADKGAGAVLPEHNTIFVYEFDKLTVCHLGDLGEVPSQAQVESMSKVDILLIPVGGGATLDAARAAEVISLLEPSIVIPMHYLTPYTHLALDPVDKFLKEMGLPVPPVQDMLKISASELPEETQVVVLDCKQS